MTPEEKSRAYDEAIKKAAVLYKASEPMSGCNVIIETLFPELKESEDERIRGAIIDHLKDNNLTEWVAWLKKQGKPSDEEMKTLLRTEYEKGRADAIAGMQMEWSEEDEKQARQIERIVHNDGCTQKLQKQIADWLKSIKDKVQPKTKQEWSEEDDQYIIDTLNLLSFGCSSHSVGEVKDFLKSLKERYTWKPSDEQIEILDMVLTNESMDDNIARILRELREQLKKLK